MSESYRATLLIVGFVVALSVASWRLLQIDVAGRTAPAARAPTIHNAPPPQIPVPNTHPSEQPQVPQDHVAELIDAALHGDIAKILELKAQGIGINTVDSEGVTPLLAAISKGSATPTLIEKLLKAGADASKRDAQGRDALTLAAEKDDVSSIAALLSASSKLAGKAAGALITAAGHNHLEALKALLDNGVDVNAADKHGQTALSAAVQEGDAETVQFLLDHSADPNHKNSEKLNALMLAVARGKNEIVQPIVQKIGNVNERDSGGETALMQAVRASNLDVAKTLAESGSDVNAVDFDASTPLMAAASAGQNEMVQLLVDKGANVHARDSRGKTALDLARDNSHQDTADLIAKAGGADDNP